MELIKPSEISGKIMTLIDEAKKFICILSPYNKVSNWVKLTRKIESARNRGVIFYWGIRSNNVDEENYNEVRSLGIEPIMIPDLHAKIYLNDTKGILTSMNLSYISDSKSIDLGYATTTVDEHAELANEFIRIIKNYSETLLDFEDFISRIYSKLKQKYQTPEEPICDTEDPWGENKFIIWNIIGPNSLLKIDLLEEAAKISVELEIFNQIHYPNTDDELELKFSYLDELKRISRKGSYEIISLDKLKYQYSFQYFESKISSLALQDILNDIIILIKCVKKNYYDYDLDEDT